tara:strand:+ start:1913 stop:3034 length:1122 start_codon:yes stop_codon:yes gene_type:complete
MRCARTITNFNKGRRNYNIPIYHKDGYQQLYMNNSEVDYRQNLNDDTISVLGYGPQGRAQSLNLRDNNINVILGLRKHGKSWIKALNDGWIPNQNLFEIEEATHKGNIIKYLISDVGQIAQWKNIKNFMYDNNTLYFSHGFSIFYNNYTNINPSSNINVIMVAPKCSGNTVRKNYKNNKGFMSSYAIHQNIEGGKNLKNKTLALGFMIGSNSMFETTFEKEVKSDLTGERCVLMGMIQGAFIAQYNVLREKGHSPLEAYNETIEEALNSLYPIIHENGMDWLYKNCSTTAQRGALDWAPKFEKVLKPVIEECYKSVENETEIRRLIECNNDKEYNKKLDKELLDLSSQEMWQIKKQIGNIKKYSKNRDNIFLL